MENYNRVDLTLIPPDGIDPNITCTQCPSACCREGMALPMNANEAQNLRAAGTEIEQLGFSRRERKKMHLKPTEEVYALRTDCGNFMIDDNGNTSCRVFNEVSPVRPQICEDFQMGGFACGAIQLNRVKRNQDNFVAE